MCRIEIYVVFGVREFSAWHVVKMIFFLKQRDVLFSRLCLTLVLTYAFFEKELEICQLRGRNICGILKEQDKFPAATRATARGLSRNELRVVSA